MRSLLTRSTTGAVQVAGAAESRKAPVPGEFESRGFHSDWRGLMAAASLDHAPASAFVLDEDDVPAVVLPPLDLVPGSERTLALAVILHALREARDGDRGAQEWLESDSCYLGDFRVWAWLSGVDYRDFRRQLEPGGAFSPARRGGCRSYFTRSR